MNPQPNTPEYIFAVHVLSYLDRIQWPNCAEVRAEINALHTEDPTGSPRDIAGALEANAVFDHRTGVIRWPQNQQTNPPTARGTQTAANLSMAQGGGTYQQPTPARQEIAA